MDLLFSLGLLIVVLIIVFRQSKSKKSFYTLSFWIMPLVAFVSWFFFTFNASQDIHKLDLILWEELVRGFSVSPILGITAFTSTTLFIISGIMLIRLRLQSVNKQKDI